VKYWFWWEKQFFRLRFRLVPFHILSLVTPENFSRIVYLHWDIFKMSVWKHSLTKRLNTFHHPRPSLVSEWNALTQSLVEEGTRSSYLKNIYRNSKNCYRFVNIFQLDLNEFRIIIA
jgi:hypothetical protein